MPRHVKPSLTQNEANATIAAIESALDAEGIDWTPTEVTALERAIDKLDAALVAKGLRR